MNMDFKRKLPVPMEVKGRYPLTDCMKENKADRDREIRKIFAGESSKLLLVIGPCSADREDSVLEYSLRLAELQEKVRDHILIVPRVYSNKPRTTGDGYKGMLHQPDPVKKPDLLAGITASRLLHMHILEQTGLSTADELLYPENYKYFDDLLSYVAVGARSVEDQQHRLTAGGMEVPAGMKNPTGGNMNVMMNSIHAAQQPQAFIYRGWEAVSKGNPYAHAVLRGYTGNNEKSCPNYHYEDLKNLCRLYDLHKELKNPAFMIDASHDNSGRDPFQQGRIVREVLWNRSRDEDIRSLLKGFLIESYLEDGSQAVGGGCYGKSITDPCLGWEKSERLVMELAEILDHNSDG